MSNEVRTRKRRAISAQIANWIAVAEIRIIENADKNALLLSSNLIKGIAETLKRTNAQMKQFLTVDTADVEYERVIEYELRITTTLSKLETAIQNTMQGTQEGSYSKNFPTLTATAPSDANEPISCPSLKWSSSMDTH